MPGGRSVTLDDVCHMSDEYIAAGLAHAATTTGTEHMRVVLALEPGSVHGGGPAARERAQSIVAKYGALVYDGPHLVSTWGLELDLTTNVLAHPPAIHRTSVPGPIELSLYIYLQYTPSLPHHHHT